MARSAPLRLGHAQHALRRLDDVLQGGEVRKELKVLKHHADQSADLARRLSVATLASRQQAMRPDADFPLIEIVQAIDAAQQRRFAAAAGADQGHGLAGLHRQADLVEHHPRRRSAWRPDPYESAG